MIVNNHMRFGYIFILFLLFSCSKYLSVDNDISVDYIGFDNNEKVEEKLHIRKTGLSVNNCLTFNGEDQYCQGMAIKHNVMYKLHTSGVCQTFDVTNIDNPLPISVFKLGSFMPTNHSNCAQFSNDSEDSIIYISGLCGKCYVERINSNSSELIQTITVGLKDFQQDFNIICGDDGYLWAFGGMKPSGSYCLFKLRKPLLTEGDVILDNNDLIASWIVDDSYFYSDKVWQGGKSYVGKLFLVFGSYYAGKQIIVFDTLQNEIIGRVTLDEMVYEEP